MHNFDYYNSMVISLVMTSSNTLDFRNVRLNRIGVDKRLYFIYSAKGLFFMDPNKLVHYSIIVSQIIKWRFDYSQRPFICELLIRIHNSVKSVVNNIGVGENPLTMLITNMILYHENPDRDDAVNDVFQRYSLKHESEKDPVVIPEKETAYFDVYNQ
jgi:hypothetical protein